VVVRSWQWVRHHTGDVPQWFQQCLEVYRVSFYVECILCHRHHCYCWHARLECTATNAADNLQGRPFSVIASASVSVRLSDVRLFCTISCRTSWQSFPTPSTKEAQTESSFVLRVGKDCQDVRVSYDTRLYRITGDQPNSRFHAVTFSVKLAFFREKCPFPCFREIRDFSWILTLLLSYMKVFRVLSTAFVRILLFATCRTSALSSSHVFTVLLIYIQSWVLT